MADETERLEFKAVGADHVLFAIDVPVPLMRSIRSYCRQHSMTLDLFCELAIRRWLDTSDERARYREHVEDR